MNTDSRVLGWLPCTPSETPERERGCLHAGYVCDPVLSGVLNSYFSHALISARLIKNSLFSHCTITAIRDHDRIAGYRTYILRPGYN